MARFKQVLIFSSFCFLVSATLVGLPFNLQLSDALGAVRTSVSTHAFSKLNSLFDLILAHEATVQQWTNGPNPYAWEKNFWHHVDPVVTKVKDKDTDQWTEASEEKLKKVEVLLGRRMLGFDVRSLEELIKRLIREIAVLKTKSNEASEALLVEYQGILAMAQAAQTLKKTRNQQQTLLGSMLQLLGVGSGTL